MKTTILSLILTAAMGIASAAPVLTLTPPGPVSGAPGSAVGWGFHLTSDPTEWIVVIASFTTDESNPSLGFYFDLIGSQGGPVNGVLPPGDPDWIQDFDAIAGTGVGYFQIFPDAPLLSVNSGNIHVLYERFSADPATCGACLLDSGDLIVPFSFSVDTAVPEPGTLSILGLGLGALAIWRRRLAG